jgi:hypothetical protein
VKDNLDTTSNSGAGEEANFIARNPVSRDPGTSGNVAPAPNRTTPRIQQRSLPATTIPPGIQRGIIIRGSGRIIPWVNAFFTANDLIQLAEYGYEYYRGTNRESMGSAGDFSFPEQPAPPPYNPAIESPGVVGDRSREPDAVIRRQVGDVTRPQPSNQPRLQPLPPNTPLPGSSEPSRAPQTPRIGSDQFERRGRDWSDFNNGSLTPSPVTPEERRGSFPVTTTKPGQASPDIRRNSPRERTGDRNRQEEFDIRKDPSRRGPRGSAQPQRSETPATTTNAQSSSSSNRGRQTTRGRQGATRRRTTATTTASNGADADLAQKYKDRDIKSLSAAELKELRERGYTLSREPKTGRPTIRRTNSESGELGLHVAQNPATKVWELQPGPGPVNSRSPSNSSTMKSKFRERYGVDAPEGYDLHHLISVNSWQKSNLTQQAQKLGVSSIDDGLVAVPSDAAAARDNRGNIPKLEKARGLVKIPHPGSHPKWDERVNKLLNDEEKRLQAKYRVRNLEDVPVERLEELKKDLNQSIESVRKQLGKELQDAAENLKKGRYDLLPEWIEQYQPRDRNQPPYRKISEQPEQMNRQARQDTGNFGKVARAFTAKVKEKSDYAMHNTHAFRDMPRSLQGSDTAQGQAQMIALSILPLMAGRDFLQNRSLGAYRSGNMIDVFNESNGSKIASINLSDSSNPTVSMSRPLSNGEITDLNSIQVSRQTQQDSLAQQSKQNQLG